jgi:hypothetical protein
MLTGGKARGGFDIIGQGGNAKNESIRGLLGPKSCARANPAFAKRARKAQDASQGTDAVLLLGGKL